jgi:hypothetical protein
MIMFRLSTPPLSISRFCRNMRQTVSTRVLVPEKLEIKLTETENSICNLLDECVRFLKIEKGISTTCRVAGGWVRDKVNPGFNFCIQENQSKPFLAFRPTES